MKITNAVALIGMVLVSLGIPTDAQGAENVNLSPTLTGNYDTPGTARGVAVSGNYAYVADYGDGLHIFDISTPSSPTLLGTYDTSGDARRVAVSGNYAYVADHGDGLQIIDISTPSSPSLLGTYETGSHASGVAVSGNYAYVSDHTRGLYIIDVTTPSSPTLLGTYDTPGTAWGVAVSGNYAYVANRDEGLLVIDISTPSNPSLFGSYDTSGGAYDVVVSGNYAYVADMGWSEESVYYGGFHIIDISTPSSPSLLGTYDTSDYARGVAVSGNYAYVADHASGLQIIHSGLSMPDTEPAVMDFAQFAYVGDEGYATADGSTGRTLYLGGANADGSLNNTATVGYQVYATDNGPGDVEVKLTFDWSSAAYAGHKSKEFLFKQSETMEQTFFLKHKTPEGSYLLTRVELWDEANNYREYKGDALVAELAAQGDTPGSMGFTISFDAPPDTDPSFPFLEDSHFTMSIDGTAIFDMLGNACDSHDDFSCGIVSDGWTYEQTSGLGSAVGASQMPQFASAGRMGFTPNDGADGSGPGAYSFTYRLTDGAGNTSNEATFTLAIKSTATDTEPPEVDLSSIRLLGPDGQPATEIPVFDLSEEGSVDTVRYSVLVRDNEGGSGIKNVGIWLNRFGPGPPMPNSHRSVHFDEAEQTFLEQEIIFSIPLGTNMVEGEFGLQQLNAHDSQNNNIHIHQHNIYGPDGIDTTVVPLRFFVDMPGVPDLEPPELDISSIRLLGPDGQPATEIPVFDLSEEGSVDTVRYSVLVRDNEGGSGVKNVGIWLSRFGEGPGMPNGHRSVHFTDAADQITAEQEIIFSIPLGTNIVEGYFGLQQMNISDGVNNSKFHHQHEIYGPDGIDTTAVPLRFFVDMPGEPDLEKPEIEIFSFRLLGPDGEPVNGRSFDTFPDTVRYSVWVRDNEGGSGIKYGDMWLKRFGSGPNISRSVASSYVNDAERRPDEQELIFSFPLGEGSPSGHFGIQQVAVHDVSMNSMWLHEHLLYPGINADCSTSFYIGEALPDSLGGPCDSYSPGTVNQPPTAVAQALSVVEHVHKLNSESEIDMEGSDPDGDGLSFRIVDWPKRGLLYTGAESHGPIPPRVWYEPNVGFTGSDGFTFTVTDPKGAVSEVASVDIEVLAADDPKERWADAAYGLRGEMADYDRVFDAGDSNAEFDALFDELDDTPDWFVGPVKEVGPRPPGDWGTDYDDTQLAPNCDNCDLGFTFRVNGPTVPISALGVFNYIGPGQPNGIGEPVEVGLFRLDSHGPEPAWEMITSATVGPDSDLMDGFRYEPIPTVEVRCCDEYAVLFSSAPSATGVEIFGVDDYHTNLEAQTDGLIQYRNNLAGQSNGTFPDEPPGADAVPGFKVDAGFLVGWTALSDSLITAIDDFGSGENFLLSRGEGAQSVMDIPSKGLTATPFEGTDSGHHRNTTIAPDGSAVYVEGYGHNNYMSMYRVDLSTLQTSIAFDQDDLEEILKTHGDLDEFDSNHVNIETMAFTADGMAVRAGVEVQLAGPCCEEASFLLEVPLGDGEPSVLWSGTGDIQMIDIAPGRDRILVRLEEEIDNTRRLYYDLHDLNTGATVSIDPALSGPTDAEDARLWFDDINGTLSIVSADGNKLIAGFEYRMPTEHGMQHIHTSAIVDLTTGAIEMPEMPSPSSWVDIGEINLDELVDYHESNHVIGWLPGDSGLLISGYFGFMEYVVDESGNTNYRHRASRGLGIFDPKSPEDGMRSIGNPPGYVDQRSLGFSSEGRFLYGVGGAWDPVAQTEHRYTYKFDLTGENEVVVLSGAKAIYLGGPGGTKQEEGWQVPLSVKFGEDAVSNLVFGVASWATDGRDIDGVPIEYHNYQENVLPPLPPEGANDARFLLDGDNPNQGSFVDLRAEATGLGDTLAWKLQIVSTTDVVIRWDSDALDEIEGRFLLRPMSDYGALYGAATDMSVTDSVVSVYSGESKRELCLYFSSAAVTVSFELNGGWNLVSVPGHPESRALEDLFPDALSLWGWDNSGTDHQYVQADEVAPGLGYWLNLTSDLTRTVVADVPVDQTKSLPVGWNLTGVFKDRVAVEQLKMAAPQIRSVFGYDGAYHLADVLIPGKGYWMKVTDKPIAALDFGQFEPAPETAVAKRLVAESSRLPTLYAVGENSRIALELGADDPEVTALPPVPPTGSVDARILLSEYDSWMTPKAADTYPVRFQEIQELTWKFGRFRDGMWSLELADGRHVALEGDGSLSLGGGVIHGLLHQTKEARQYSYDLRSNFPNPFNPTTTIGYEIGAGGHVKLAIFNVLGQRVRVLVDSEQSPGAYRMVWDGRNDSGLALAAGTYFLRMQSGRYVQTRKMVLSP